MIDFTKKRFIHHRDTEDTENHMAVHRKKRLQTRIFPFPCTLRVRGEISSEET